MMNGMNSDNIMDPHDASQQPRKRRSHTKSRAGCGNCKRRRIKCDEARPICHSCIKFSIPCDFSPALAAAAVSNNHSEQEAGGPTSQRRRGPGRPRKGWTITPNTCASSSTGSSPATGPLSIMANASTASFSTDDMELLYHYLTDPVFRQGDADLWQHRVPRLGFRYGCVLHMLLAVSALHLARMQPAESPRLRHLAEDHAGPGIRGTMELLPQMDRDNCGALYISSTLIFTFSLAKGPSPTDLLLAAGGTEVPWWEPLKGVRFIFQNMGPAAIFSGLLEPPSGPGEPAAEPAAETTDPVSTAVVFPITATMLRWEEALQRLPNLVVASQCPSADMLLRTLDSLRDCFRATFGTAGNPQETIVGKFEVVMRWLYVLEDDFMLHVRQQHPVALVLLAHFAVVLRTVEYAWFMEGWAKHILRRVEEVLEPHLVKWLKWPNEVIGTLAAQQS